MAYVLKYNSCISNNRGTNGFIATFGHTAFFRRQFGVSERVSGFTGENPMTIVVGIVTILIFGYLFFALLNPEKFG